MNECERSHVIGIVKFVPNKIKKDERHETTLYRDTYPDKPSILVIALLLKYRIKQQYRF